jgi:hypothetical protein
MKRHALVVVLGLLSAACSSSKEPVGIAASGGRPAVAAPSQATEMAFALGAGAPATGGVAGGAVRAGASQPADPVSYLAYAYGVSLEIPGDRLVAVMDAHAAACRDAGPRVCQLVGSRRAGDPADTLRGSLSLRAEPQWLQQFMIRAQTDARDAAGRVTGQWTTTEDLTREIVDTEATLKAKRALRDRLQQLLSTRPGSLADLLGVERELARVQGEIDSTESTLAAMRTRVAMSALTIEYQSSAGAIASGTFAPLQGALANFVLAAVDSTAALISVVGALLPWVVAVALVVWGLVRIRRRRRARRAAPAGQAAPANPTVGPPAGP